MKRFRFLLTMLVVTFVIVLAGCSGSAFDNEFNVTAANFDSTIKNIRSSGKYLVRLSGDLTNYPGVTLETAGADITVMGTGSNYITWNREQPGGGHLFHVKAGKLTLENINISKAIGAPEGWNVLVVEGGTLEMKNGVTLSNSNSASTSEGVGLRGTGSKFIMSGGTIQNVNFGVTLDGTVPSFTMSGGTIKALNIGIGVWGNSTGAVVDISGGTISSGENTITVSGSSPRLNISGGTITGTGHTIGLWSDAINATLNISGKAVINSDENGIAIGGPSGVTINVTGGKISGAAGSGIASWDGITNTKINISGGEITGHRGVTIDGTGNTITVTGGKITSTATTEAGSIVLFYGSGNSLSIQNGEVSGPVDAVVILGNGHTVNITGGKVTGGTGYGVAVWDSNVIPTIGSRANVTGGSGATNL